jgi:hypothetical protein
MISLLIGLVVPGYLMTQAMGGGGSSLRADDAAQLVQEASLLGAARTVEEHWRATGTYAGAPVDGSTGVRLALADADSYCLELRSPNEVWHQAGPANGAGDDFGPSWAAQPGPCPGQ